MKILEGKGMKREKNSQADTRRKLAKPLVDFGADSAKAQNARTQKLKWKTDPDPLGTLLFLLALALDDLLARERIDRLAPNRHDVGSCEPALRSQGQGLGFRVWRLGFGV
eukprot:420429-Rhodomonas_salina.1